MKVMKKTLALCLILLMILSVPVSASAAQIQDYLIDPDRETSLTLFMYDLSGAEKDGVWDSSYVSTGVYDQTVIDTLGSSEGNSYAVKGAGFTYCKIADIIQFDDATDGQIEVLYAIDKTAGADFLAALGLENGANRYQNADTLDSSKYYYQSDVLNSALEAALAANSTTVKNALESYAQSNGTAMPLTDEYGKSQVQEMEQGLFLLVNSILPSNVTASVDPFLVSLPMTSVNGTNAANGGEIWNYDVTVYPKCRTGSATLEKTIRESMNDTGKNDGKTNDITDGYAHTGTASDGDVVDYQIVSTLPAITSTSTYLSEYTFLDTLSKGLSYCKEDVVLEFFSDTACTQPVAKWIEAEGKFTVAYGTDDGDSTMTISMTEAGLNEINTSKAVYTEANMTNSGYSDCTLRITYKAQLHTDGSVVYGDSGNPNQVVLRWKRSSQNDYEILTDDSHLFTYGLELTKLFSDDNGDYSQVQFTIYNKTDDYFVKAAFDESSGVYYAADHVDKDDATKFVPVKNTGKITVKGLEDDEYILSEIKTADGYTLLRNDITVVISQEETSGMCSISEHHLLTAAATVDGKAVNMLEDNGSKNAEAPLRVINTKGFTLPKTGDNGVWMYGVIGILLMAASVAVFAMSCRKKKNSQ